jgi:hypothetical protein
MGLDDMECIYLAQNRDQKQALLNNATDCWVPYNDENKLTSTAINSFSRKNVFHGVNS